MHESFKNSTCYTTYSAFETYILVFEINVYHIHWAPFSMLLNTANCRQTFYSRDSFIRFKAHFTFWKLFSFCCLFFKNYDEGHYWYSADQSRKTPSTFSQCFVKFITFLRAILFSRRTLWDHKRVSIDDTKLRNGPGIKREREEYLIECTTWLEII